MSELIEPSSKVFFQSLLSAPVNQVVEKRERMERLIEENWRERTLITLNNCTPSHLAFFMMVTSEIGKLVLSDRELNQFYDLGRTAHANLTAIKQLPANRAVELMYKSIAQNPNASLDMYNSILNPTAVQEPPF